MKKHKIIKLYLDFGTYGLKPDVNTIKDLAYIITVNGKIVEEKYIKCILTKRPRYMRIIDWNEHNKEAVPIETLAKTLLNDILNRKKDDCKVQVVAYNAQFDTEFLRWLFNNFILDYKYNDIFWTPSFCVMSYISNKLISNGKRYLLKNMKLETVSKFYGLEITPKNSIRDVLLLFNVFKKSRYGRI